MNHSYMSSEYSAHMFNECLYKNEMPRPILGSTPKGFRGTITNVSHTIHGYLFDSDDGVIAYLVSSFVEGVYYFDRNELLLRHEHSAIANKTDKIKSTLASLPDIKKLELPDLQAESLILLSGSQFHPSHYLWNHLSGLHYFLCCCSHANIQRVLVVEGNQQYGKIDNIYPELSSKVSHLDSDFASTPFFSEHRIIEPYYAMGVPLGIRLRIAKQAGVSLEHRQPKDNLSPLTIALGPRIMDRSCTNKLNCYKVLLDVCRLNAVSSVKIILDISTRLDKQRFIPDMGVVNKLFSDIQGLATSSGLKCEIQLLHDMPFEDSLKILESCHFGLYEWGGGLAKFSWILGKPCIITAPSKVNDILSETLIGRRCWGTYVYECARDTPYLVPNEANVESANQRGNAAFLVDYTVSLTELKDAVSRCMHESLCLDIC